MSGTTVFIDQNGVFAVHRLSSVVTISPRQATSLRPIEFFRDVDAIKTRSHGGTNVCCFELN
jgi:hypothetical protein